MKFMMTKMTLMVGNWNLMSGIFKSCICLCFCLSTLIHSRWYIRVSKISVG